MRALGLLAALLLLATPAAAARAEAAAVPTAAGAARAPKAADESFLFSSQALRQLEAARAGEAPAAVPVVRSSPAPAPAAVIHLAAILYHAPDDWRIWLNGQSFTPAGRPGPIEILKVTAERVVLAWRPGSGGPPRRVELRPNQTYVVASGAVVEGKLEPRR